MAETLGVAILELRTDDKRFGKGLDSAETRAQALAVSFGNVSKRITQATVLAVAAVGTMAVKMASDFESSFAGVRKTVDATEAEFAELARGLRDLAKEIPVNVNELNSIAEAAGQLGIKKDAILGFTETMANLGVATNVTAEQAAVSMAQIANVTKLPTDQFGNLGSALVDLGNNFATNEAKILDFSTRIAGAGATVGLTTPQIFGIGTAFASVGVGAEAGGTAVQKVLLEMLTAVEQGGDTLETFAATASMTGEEFAAAFRDDAGAAFASFVTGLGEQGTAAISTLAELGLEDQRLISSFLRVASAGDIVTEAMATGTEAFAENTALTKEAEERYKTFESQLTLAWNRIKDVAITFGQELLPALTSGLKVIGEIAQNKDFIEFFKAAGTIIGWTLSKLVEFINFVGGKFREGMRAHGQAWLDVSLAMERLPRFVKALIPNFENLQGSAFSLSGVFESFVNTGGDVADVLGDVQAETESTLAPVVALTGGVENLGAAADATAESLQSVLDKLANEAFQRMKQHEQQIRDIAGEYEELATNTLPDVVTELDNVVGAVGGEQGGKLAGAFQAGGDSIKEIWKDVVADLAFNLVDGLLGGFDDAAKQIPALFAQAGAQLGAAGGKAVGEFFDSPILGAVGEAIGAKLGSAIGKSVGKVFAKLFGKSDPVGEALAKFGLQISKELKKIIKQTAKDLGVEAEAAMRLHLVDVMREVGVESAEALGEFAHLTELILFDLERGMISSEQATVALGGSLGELLSNFEEAGGGLSELNDIADIFGHTVASFELGQLSAAQAQEIWNDNISDFIDLAIEMGDEGLASLSAIVEQAKNAGLEIEEVSRRLAETMAEGARIMADRNSFLIDQSRALLSGIEQLFAGVGGITAREIEASAESVLSAFTAMLAAGVPLSDALSEIGAAFDLISATGLEDLPDEFQRLGEMITILSDDVIQGMISKLEGATSATMALGNMGLLSADQFDVFGDRVDRTFKRLVDGGLTGEEALAAIAPQLQLLHDLSQQYGFEVDNITSGLIDQAMAQGLVADKGLTTEDILIRGFDAMLQGVNALIVALGGIPLAFDQWTEATGETVAASTSGFSEIATTAIDTAGETEAVWSKSADGVRDMWATTTSAIGDNVSSMVDSFRRDFRNIPMNFDVKFTGGGGGGGRGGDPFAFAEGSGGFVDFGAGSPAMLHGTEEVITAAQGVGVARMVQAAIQNAGRGPSRDGVLAELQGQTGLLVEAFDQRDKHHKVDATNADRRAKVRRAPFRSETPGTIC